MNSNDSIPPSPPGRSRMAAIAGAATKTGMTAAVILGLAFGFATLGTDGEVSKSHADIFDLNFGPQDPNQERFEAALQSLGHEQPQTFEINGNIVHFSVDYRREAPTEVAKEYQREFVRNKINDQAYDSPGDASESPEALTARLAGEITPLEIRSDRVEMGGMITNNRAGSSEELLEDVQDIGQAEDMFRGHRWVEMYREPGQDETTVLATWSDEDFSFANMIPDDDLREQSDRRLGTDTEVPACPGCIRVHQFEDLNEQRGYATNIFITESETDSMLEFYRTAMQRRGWEVSEFQETHRQLGEVVEATTGSDREALFLKRGDDRLEILAYPVDDGDYAIQTARWEDADVSL